MKKIFLYFILVFYCGCSSQTSTICVLNNSSEKIVSGSIKISKYFFKFNNIGDGESVCFDYQVYSDDHYSVELQLLSKTLRANLGYITGGFVFHDKIIVHPSSLDLEPSFELDEKHNSNVELCFSVFLASGFLIGMFVLYKIFGCFKKSLSNKLQKP